MESASPRSADPSLKTRPSAWSPLGIAIYRNLWIANVISNVGSTMNDTAAVWTMTTLSHSPVLVTLMQTMASLPLFIFALPAGAIADVVDRRSLIQAAQWGALLTAAGMAFLAWTGHLTSTLLLVGTFQLGVATAFTTPAWQALLPELVGRPQLPAALALGSVGFNLARASGPVIGGFLVAALGPGPVFTLNAISFGAVILAMWRSRSTALARESDQEQVLSAIGAALRYARHAPAMQAVLWRGGIHVFAAVAPVALLPILIKNHGWNGSDFGILMGCYGVGAVGMALFVLPRLRMRHSFDWVLVLAAWGSALACALLIVVPNLLAMGATQALAGACWMTALNTFSVAGQSAFPNWVRARSSAIYLVVVQGSYAVGALAWGRLISDFNATVALGTAALWLAASALLCRWRPLSHIEKLDLTPSSHWPDHTLTVIPAPNDGPVLVTIQYRIDPAQAVAFCQAISLLRLVRLRDGAFRWSLFNDLDDPPAYRETFLVGSWAEHLRQHRRATVEDLRIEASVAAFHQGAQIPDVRHLLKINVQEVAESEGR